ncbi:MAG: cytochrome C [Caldilineaceae bacterium]|nr:cytochrome C [Caldilineaceae bacterium]
MTEQRTRYYRFDEWQRLEHAVLIASFTVLAVTGLPQKFSSQLWANLMIAAMGGIEMVRVIHRVAAVVLILETIYHFGVVTYKVFVQRLPLTMLLSLQDVKDGLYALGHNVGIFKEPPKMGRYNFGEKVEYWAVIWGTLVMVLTGFILWNPIATSTFLPGQVIPASKAAHGGEALLAVLSIVTWHVYNVHIKQFNRSMFTGYISRHEMEEEHAIELAEIEAHVEPPPQDPERFSKRVRVFVPVAVIITAVMLTGLYMFVTYEQTAITTVPRQQIEVFVPQTPAVQPAP